MKLPRLRAAAAFQQLGPGLVTGAADDDPSGIATYSQAGARYGFALLWTMVLTFPLMVAVQLIAARIGRVTGQGLAANMKAVFPKRVVTLLVTLLFVANTINIGADLAAMGAAAALVIPWHPDVFTIGFALLSLVLQLAIPYHRYARLLKWLTLVLLAYVAVVFMVKLDWSEVALALIKPQLPAGAGALQMVVAIFGTTISPYLFFWQSSQEVEEIGQHADELPLRQAPSQAKAQLFRIRIDTFAGMAVSNLIAIAIIIATAATLHAGGEGAIETAADAAQALRPAAGDFAFLLFSLGIIGTGLLAVPVLAGSAAYAVGESRGWKTGLENKPWEARGFYAIIGLATLIGLAFNYLGVDPIKALIWSAVLNGVIAVPIMAAMMVVAGRPSQLGRFMAGAPLLIFGWAATALMGAAVVAMVVFR
jgi:NRAMP (natural resistance-associated macrophage protein)-like metal ion transporter